MSSNADIEEILQEAEKFPWWRLTHCRGLATDVPQILRDLTSQDEDVREEAVNDGLFDRLTHQYTVYPASVYAVPYLVGILHVVHTDTRPSIVAYLHRVVSVETSTSHHFASVLQLGLERPDVHQCMLSIRNGLNELVASPDSHTAEAARQLLKFCDDPEHFSNQAKRPVESVT
jgi:hypothetical protein